MNELLAEGRVTGEELVPMPFDKDISSGGIQFKDSGDAVPVNFQRLVIDDPNYIGSIARDASRGPFIEG